MENENERLKREKEDLQESYLDARQTAIRSVVLHGAMVVLGLVCLHVFDKIYLTIVISVFAGLNLFWAGDMIYGLGKIDGAKRVTDLYYERMWEKRN